MRAHFALALVFVAVIGMACGEDGSGSPDDLVEDGRSAPDLPGEFIDIDALYGDDARAHITEDVDYAADQGLPPTGGPHWGSSACPADPSEAPPFCGPVPWGVYREPWPEESLMHNIEHGGVIIWYGTTEQSLIDELEQYAVEELNDQRFLVVVPYPELDEEVALTSWTRRDRFPVSAFSVERVEEFVQAHERRYNPEGF